MIPKLLRLSRRDFLLAKSQGRSLSSPHFSATVYQRPAADNQQPTRYSVVTSSKLAKSAVIRNRLRRRIYHRLSTIDRQLSTDIILYPRPSVLNLSDADLAAGLNSLLSKIAPG